ncbi:hypothetical protein BJX62DRAFT_13948 [Aspergillus germanicus]
MVALLIHKDTRPFSSSSADIMIPTEARLDECQRDPIWVQPLVPRPWSMVPNGTLGGWAELKVLGTADTWATFAITGARCLFPPEKGLKGQALDDARSWKREGIPRNTVQAMERLVLNFPSPDAIQLALNEHGTSSRRLGEAKPTRRSSGPRLTGSIVRSRLAGLGWPLSIIYLNNLLLTGN